MRAVRAPGVIGPPSPSLSRGPRLTEEQEQAVARRSEPLLLSAGAGSGKTSVLVERFVRAVLEDELAPGKILAITFTERAAGELRERVRGRFLALGEREAARDTEAAFVSTFHGFCARLLRAHPLLAGLDPEFSILDEGLAGALRERALSSSLAAFLSAERPAALDLIAAYGVDQVNGMIAGIYSELRSRGERFPRLPAFAGDLPSATPNGRPAGAGPREGQDPSAGGHDPPAEAQEQRARAALDAQAGAACELLDELLGRFGEAYEALKRARGALDFDDLELLARELLEHRPSVREAWSGRFELLMVDEFQDTNPRQLGILQALDRGNLFTVGDELQSIYGFRHAEVGLFRERQAELAERGASLALRRNFRSRPALLEVVNAIFAERLGSAFSPLLAGREEAAQASVTAGPGSSQRETPAGEPLVELLLSAKSGWEDSEELAGEIALGLPPATIWRQAEARLLAQRVEELVSEGIARAGEIVVLLRAVGDIEVYERALQLRGLRTLAMVGGFWGRLQTRDLLAYLRALANPLDEQALYETLASPLVGLNSDSLALLAHGARVAGHGVWRTAGEIVASAHGAPVAGAENRSGELGARRMAGAAELLERMAASDRKALVRFHARFEPERRAASRRSISRLIERAIEASGYREHVLALEWGERRLANIHKLLRLARRFEASEGRDLRGFLDHVDRLAEASGTAEPDAPVDGVEPDAVRLMTIHAAKGLEFPVVCVADLGRATNMRMGRLLVDGPRMGLALLRLDGEKAAPALEYEQLCEERRRAQAEEEDRILYVAMTRARERLLLSGALDVEQWPQAREGAPPISWLAPALVGELPLPLHAIEPPVADLVLAGEHQARVRCRLSSPASLGAVLRLPGASSPNPEGGEPASPDGAPALSPDAAQAPSAEDASGQLSMFAMEAVAAASGERVELHSGVQAQPSDGITTLSYTALAELERCGYRYYLERILGLPEDRAAARAAGEAAREGGLEARARGTLVHGLLERLEIAPGAAPSAQELTRLARELGLRVSAAEREELLTLIRTANASPLARRVAAVEGVRREHHFAFALGPGEPLFTGVIDLLAREADGGVIVLDYKSDRVGAEVDLEALVERDYGVQRLLYALAVLRDGAPSVEVIHWFLERPEEPVGARFPDSDREALEELLSARVAAARERAFAVSPRPHRGLCLTCPGRAALCSWTEAQTLREDPAEPSG